MMKPITDDDVFSIMKGLEQRERSRRKALDVARKTLPEKILATVGTGRVISLDLARRRAHQTVSGMFCYVAGD